MAPLSPTPALALPPPSSASGSIVSLTTEPISRLAALLPPSLHQEVDTVSDTAATTAPSSSSTLGVVQTAALSLLALVCLFLVLEALRYYVYVRRLSCLRPLTPPPVRDELSMDASEFFGRVRRPRFDSRSLESFKVSAASADLPCAICLGSLGEDDDVAFGPCGHEFHHRCLQAWLAKRPECPICRHQFVPGDGAIDGAIANSVQGGGVARGGTVGLGMDSAVGVVSESESASDEGVEASCGLSERRNNSTNIIRTGTVDSAEDSEVGVVAMGCAEDVTEVVVTTGGVVRAAKTSSQTLG